jgi:tRNA(Ile)-lysidine synthase
VLDRIIDAINRHAMFEPGQAIGVAVSGGADSMCLLEVLRELAPRWNLSLRVLHVNHKLRGAESDADADFVRAAAERLALPCEVEIAPIHGGNLEQAARDSRRAFFLRLLREGIVDRVALGHTLDDQAETVLFRFLRGAGSAGLAGIRPVTKEGIVRPLLYVERAEVTGWLRARQVPWREDSSNRSREFARNRIRHDLLPQLSREWNPGLAATLAQTAEWARAEEEWWEAEMDRRAEPAFVRQGPAILMRASDLAVTPASVARRLVRRAFLEAKGDLRSIGFPHVEAVLELARDHAGEGSVHVPRLVVERSFDWLRVAPPEPVPPDFRIPLAAPGRTPAPGTVLVTELTEKQGQKFSGDCRYNETVSCLDWSVASGKLEVRNWRPGDQYQPAGHPGAEKLKLLFHKFRVPSWERNGWPMVVRGDEILWSRKFGAAAGAVATASGPVLVIREERFDGIGGRQSGV